MLLPAAMVAFAWKAAVFPWGSGLLAVAVGVIASHVLLPFSRFSWRSKALLSVSAAIIAAGVMFGFGPPHRSFRLFRADLSGQWLFKEDLRGADLGFANLSEAHLAGANLSDAYLYGANLSGADLSSANLSGSNVMNAKLDGANLADANLSDAYLNRSTLRGAFLYVAKLRGADLQAVDLSGAKLDEACGDARTRLPEGFTLKPCSTD